MAGYTAEEALAETQRTGQYMNSPKHFASEEEWAKYKHSVPQDMKRAFREKVRGNEQRAREGMAQGLTREQMGIFNRPEMGQALWRRLGMYAPGMDMGWTYDWENGIATNVGTSDLSKRGIETRRITPYEMQQHQQMQQFGGPEGFYRNARQAQIMDLLHRGQIARDGQGGYYNPGPGGGQHYGANLEGYNLGQDFVGAGRGQGRAGGYDPGSINLSAYGGGAPVGGANGLYYPQTQSFPFGGGGGNTGINGGMDPFRLQTMGGPTNLSMLTSGEGNAVPRIPSGGTTPVTPQPGTPQGNQPRPTGPPSDGGIPGDDRAVPSGTGGTNVYNQSGYQPSMQEMWLMQEMARQARMDSLMQGFEYDRAAQEYAGAQPLEDYMLSFYGDILGVDFNTPSFSLNDYFAQGMMPTVGMGASASFNGLPYGNIPGQGPQPGPSPKGQNIPGTPWYNPALPQGGGGQGIAPRNSGGLSFYEDIPPEGVPSTDLPPGPNPDGGYTPGPTPGSTSGGPGGGGPPGNPNNQIPQAVSPWSPGWTPLPELPQGGWTYKTGPALDAANRRTWGMMAPQVERMMGDTDAMLERLKQETPVGGERAQAQGDILRGARADIQGMRGNLLDMALQGVSGLAGAKKGYNPAGYSGSGGAMLSSYDSRRGQDLNYGLGMGNLQLGRDRLSFDQNQAKNNNSWWKQLMSTVGGLGASWLGGGGGNPFK